MPDANTILTYNGVDLQIGRVLGFDMRAVYDDTGVDYLYTHFRVKVSCVWNPRATASTTNNPLGDTPAASISFLRHKLLQPRQSLQINVGGDTILVAPQINADAQVPFATDANNGPHPISLDVLSVHGSKSILCVYEVETWLNECTGSSGSPPPTILSHRWEMSEDISEDYLSTRTVSGRAVFRTDFLLAENGVPDDWRYYLFHPVPANFRRTRIESTPESDGTALSYTIVDEEQVWNLDPAKAKGIIRAEGFLDEGWDWIGLVHPSVSFHFHAEVWGEPSAKSSDLKGALVTIAATVGANLTRKPMFAANVRTDFPRRHATLDIRGAFSGLGAGLFGMAFAPGLGGSKAPENFGDLGGPQAAGGANPAPPGDGGTRGESLVRIFSQLNNRPCTAPARVSDPGSALRATA